MVRVSWHHVFEASCHSISSARYQRKKNDGSQFTFSFYAF